MFKIGAATRDITGFVPGIGLMGWSDWQAEATGVAQPLLARAFVFEDPETQRRLVFVSAEICFMTQAVKEGVMRLLPGFDESEVLLAATHTHCGPGGYSGHLLYNMMVPGFEPVVYEAIVTGIAGAILEACEHAVLGRIRPAAGSFDPAVPVAFNRALNAHNCNRDRDQSFADDQRNLAINREMFLLRLEDELGNPLGAIDWFSVHATSVHSEYKLVTSDNKGFAAAAMEKALGGRVVTAFAQGAAGDVTPNFRRWPGKPFLRGQSPDDFESARFNGEAQAELALSLFADAGRNPALFGELDTVMGYFDLADIELPPRFADGYVGMRTSRAALGARMIGGTGEGGGVTSVEVDLAKAAATVARGASHVEAFAHGAAAYRAMSAHFRAHGTKDVFIEPGEGKVLGTRAIEHLPLPDSRDPVVGWLKHLRQAGTLHERPWSPHVLPLQILVIGSVALVAIPAELTTQAGRRLRASLIEVLSERGVTRVELTGYANAYAGYVTTPEEYDYQDYEGSSTHFGRWTLGAYQACFDELACELLRAPPDRKLRTLRPEPFDPAHALATQGHAEAKAWRVKRYGK